MHVLSFALLDMNKKSLAVFGGLRKSCGLFAFLELKKLSKLFQGGGGREKGSFRHFFKVEELYFEICKDLGFRISIISE